MYLYRCYNFELGFVLRKIWCDGPLFLLLRLKLRGCLDTSRLPLLLLCGHETWLVSWLICLSKPLICYHFHQKRCSCPLDSISTHIFIDYEPCIYWQFLNEGPRWQQSHLWSHLPGVHLTSPSCRLCRSDLRSCWPFSFYWYHRSWFVRCYFRMQFCCHHRMTLSRCNHWPGWSRRFGWHRWSILTRCRGLNQEQQLFDCYQTNRGDWGRNHLVGWVPTEFYMVFCLFYEFSSHSSAQFFWRF